MLLNAYNHHYIEAHFIFTIFASMSRPRTIYVVFMWSTFLFYSRFHCHWLCNLTKTHALAFRTFFRISPIIFWMITSMKKVNIYISNSKRSASGCCLAFAWFFANFSLALLINLLLIKKAYNQRQIDLKRFYWESEPNVFWNLQFPMKNIFW